MPSEKANAERENRRHLLAQKTALEDRLKSASETELRSLRVELAEVKESIVLSNRRLKDLMPQHKVSVKLELREQANEYRKWLDDAMSHEEEYEEDDMAIMQTVTDRAVEILPSKQRKYLKMRLNRRYAVHVAHECGVHPSTVGRTVKRAKAFVGSVATPAFVLRKAVRNNGKIDFSDNEQLTAFIDLLTPIQRVYISLYYGEWLTMREIGALVDKNQSVVSRAIRRGLERLSICFDESIQVDGIEHLEDLLIFYYSDIDPGTLDSKSEATAQRCQVRRESYFESQFKSKLKHAGRPMASLHRQSSNPKAYLQLYTTGGKLKEWLEGKKTQTQGKVQRWGEAIMAALSAAFDKIRNSLRGNHYADDY